MANPLRFTLVSPEKELFSGDVDMVIAPGEDGDFGVLAGHAPFMATLRLGALTIKQGAETKRVLLNGGFADVTPDGLTVLAEQATPLEDIDQATVEQQHNAARDQLGGAKTDEARANAQAQLDELTTTLEALADRAYD